MFFGSRLRIVGLLIVPLISSGSLVGCHVEACRAAREQEEDRAREAPGSREQNNEHSLRQSLEGLKPRLRALNTKFAALHEQVDPLPLNLAGFDEVRAKFYATDEGLGIMGPKLTWLSDRLDAALKAGNREQLRQVAKDIAKTYDEMRLIDQIALELVHRLPPFQKMAEEQARDRQLR